MNCTLLARNPGLVPCLLDLGVKTHTKGNLGIVACRRAVLVHIGVCWCTRGAGGHWDVQMHISMFAAPTAREKDALTAVPAQIQ